MSDNMNDAMAAPGGRAADDPAEWNAVRGLPEYRELARERRQIVLPLGVIYLAGYFGFLLLAGLAPAALAHRVHGGLTVGFILMACVFVLVWAVAFIYVRVSNRRLDRQADELTEKARAMLATGSRKAAL